MGIDPTPNPRPETDDFASRQPKKDVDLLHRVEALGKVGHWEVDLRTGQHFWSDQLFAILGLDPLACIPSSELIFGMVHRDDLALAKSELQRLVSSGESIKVESRILRPDGQLRRLVSEAVMDRDENGQPARLFGICKDITEEKRKMSSLQKSDSLLENILNTTQDLIFIADEDGGFLKISKSCEKILGYTQEELVGKSFREMVHPDDFDSTVQSRKKIMEGDASSDFQNRYFRKDGSIVHLNWSASLDYSSNTVFAVARDITQLVQTEAALKSDRQKLAIVLDSSPETIWAFDLDYNLITANTRFIQTMKRVADWNIQSGDNLVYGTPLPDEFMLEWKKHYDRALAGENFSVIRKSTLINKGGYLEVNFKPIREDGKLIAVGCYSLDVTERKAKELQMQELVTRIEQAHKIGKLGYWEVDPDTKALFWSEEIYRIWEIEQADFKPNYDHLFGSIHPEDRADFLTHHRNSWAGVRPMDTVHRIVLPSGKIKFVHERGGLEMDPITGAKRYRGTAQDVTKEKLIEKELRDRNDFIESTLRNLPLGIAVTKLSTGQATYINPAFGQTYGWDPEVFTDVETFFSKILADPTMSKKTTQQFLEDIRSADPEKMNWKNVPIVTQTGEPRIISAKNIPHPDHDLMISTVVDETDRYWAEHSLRTSNDRFHLATQAVSDAIWDWDLQKHSIFWGKGYHRLFGYPEEMEQVTEDLWQTKIHPEDLPRTWDSILEARNNPETPRWTGEYRFMKFDGSYAFVEENTVILRDQEGKPIRMVGAIRDISHHKMYEESLKKLNAELADSNRELEISNKELEQFAYVASHDLQEPLRMVTSFLGLIKLKYSHVLDEKGLQYIHHAVDGAKRMRELILDLLEFSRVGNHTETKNPTNTSQLVEEVLLLHKKTIRDKGGKVHVSQLPDIVCQSTSIVQLFQNLLTNALKYQPKGNKPEVWIEGRELEREWEFSVRDNGIGINAEFTDKIFIIFQRLHQKEQYSGSGIGLAICKKIVEFHGGKIWVESTPGTGSTFFFTLKK
ncbi:PAS domain-containing protein [Algoriphagus sp. H41]|uniref:histidine kinase n=1 Tax=Algoriphagus oliviformis TaxID=2811231 RepID=A0ABS3C7P9_9BACT|nr:PAS domain-containing protein [Algoriphagus oliviformis]MBN7812594.1 PAS domain-containing protein [Algoriphagus oliviformis]